MVKKLLTILMVAAVAGASQAADPIKGQEQVRMKTIWNAVYMRMTRQEDAWYDKGEFPKIIHLLRFHNGLEPDNYDVATNLGWMLENVQNWDEALAVYVRYKKLNPKDPDSPFPEANFYFMKKAFAKVPPLLEPSIAKKPHPNSYRILAHAYEKLRMLSDSKRVWETYLKRFPDDGAAKVNLNRVSNQIRK